MGGEVVAIAELREGKSVGFGFHGLAIGGDAGMIGTIEAWQAGTGIFVWVYRTFCSSCVMVC